MRCITPSHTTSFLIHYVRKRSQSQGDQSTRLAWRLIRHRSDKRRTHRTHQSTDVRPHLLDQLVSSTIRCRPSAHMVMLQRRGYIVTVLRHLLISTEARSVGSCRAFVCDKLQEHIAPPLHHCLYVNSGRPREGSAWHRHPGHPLPKGKPVHKSTVKHPVLFVISTKNPERGFLYLCNSRDD
jgi:hypothetical protein